MPARCMPSLRRMTGPKSSSQFTLNVAQLLIVQRTRRVDGRVVLPSDADHTDAGGLLVVAEGIGVVTWQGQTRPRDVSMRTRTYSDGTFQLNLLPDLDTRFGYSMPIGTVFGRGLHVTSISRTASLCRSSLRHLLKSMSPLVWASSHLPTQA